MIDMTKKYQTRDGRAVEILRTNVKNADFPIVGIIAECDGSETQDRWTANGWYRRPVDGVPFSADLVPVPTKHEGWVVFFAGIGNDVFGTEQAALNWLRNDTRVGRVAHVIWEES